LQDPISKNPSQNRAGEVAQGEGPGFKPQYSKKKNSRPNFQFFKDISSVSYSCHFLHSPGSPTTASFGLHLGEQTW
jgi:hypothetical protein